MRLFGSSVSIDAKLVTGRNAAEAFLWGGHQRNSKNNPAAKSRLGRQHQMQEDALNHLWLFDRSNVLQVPQRATDSTAVNRQFCDSSGQQRNVTAKVRNGVRRAKAALSNECKPPSNRAVSVRFRAESRVTGMAGCTHSAFGLHRLHVSLSVNGGNGRSADPHDNVADSVFWIKGRHCLSDQAATSTLVMSACGIPARVRH